MFRFRDQGVRARVAETFAIASLVLVSLGAESTRPQSTDNTAEAKQHYQSAVAAIGRSDWQTAKNELLQAEKLAPQNALVHYDLALAYSHTGQVKSAQAELNRSLQLGLPAEQKQAAEQLRQQLTNQATATNSTSGSSPKRNSSQGSPAKTDVPIVFMTDSDCSLSIDGESSAQLVANTPSKLRIGPGQHLVICTVGGVIFYQLTMTVTGTDSQRVVVLNIAQGIAENERRRAAKAQADQEAAAKIETGRAKLLQMQGTWHARHGDRFTTPGSLHNQGSSIQGSTVDIFESRDYEWVMNAPTGDQASGQLSIGNRTWKLIDSQIPGIVNDCFSVSGGCYTTYSWNMTQVYDVIASVNEDSSIQIKLTHNRCDGECKPSELHKSDWTGKADVSQYEMRLAFGSRGGAITYRK